MSYQMGALATRTTMIGNLELSTLCGQLASILLGVGKRLPLLMLRIIFAECGESIPPL